MKYPPRDYQIDLIGNLSKAVRVSRSAVCVLATGGGKTVIAGEIMRRAASKDAKILFLVHRRELIKQTLETLREFCPDVSVGIEAANWERKPWAQVFVGMVQSIARRDLTLYPDLIIVDEAHHVRAKTWSTVLDRWPEAILLGLTATPQRLDGKGLGKYFNELVLGPSPSELIAAGWLAPCRTLRIPLLDLRQINLDRHGEYREDDIRKATTEKVIASAVHAYEKHFKGKSTILFAPSIEHSQTLVSEFSKRGVTARHVDGKTPDLERDRILNGFREGVITLVGNCALIDEGLDVPACECVMIMRPTTSVTRWLQMCGRAMRPGIDKTAIIGDLAGSSYELGLPEEERTWTLEDGALKEGGRKKAKTRTCPRCRTAFYGTICSHCGWTAKNKRDGYTEIEIELEEAKPSATKPKKRGPVLSRREQFSRVYRALAAPHPEKAIVELGEELGYSSGWAIRKIEYYKRVGKI